MKIKWNLKQWILSKLDRWIENRKLSTSEKAYLEALARHDAKSYEGDNDSQ